MKHIGSMVLTAIALANPAMASGANVYGGHDIAGGQEAAYADTRGWNVVSGSVDGKFAYCAGELRDGDTLWRLGFDGLQWQLGVPYAPTDGEWQGAYEIDGTRKLASGVAANGWTFMWLGLQELDEVRNGNVIVLDIGRASIAHPLKGTAAAITKIEECMERQGRAGGAAAVTPAAASAGGCAGRLPGTGLCPEQAAALIGRPVPASDFGDYYAGCSWTLNETPFAGGDYLLYHAAQCKGRKSLLEFSGGARFAELKVVESAFAEGAFAPSDYPLAWIAGAEPDDPEGSVLARARAAIEDPAEARKCQVRPGTDFGFSADAYVVDVSPQEAAMAPQDEIRIACGPFGLRDSAAFWRVFQGFAWFFDLGQDAFQDIDTDSLTLVTADGKDGWKRAE